MRSARRSKIPRGCRRPARRSCSRRSTPTTRATCARRPETPIAYGLDRDAALRAVTLEPAQVWGVADRYGSLEPGKDADVVVWSGDPFELTTGPEHVFIQGREMSKDTRQRQLLDRYRTIR